MKSSQFIFKGDFRKNHIKNNDNWYWKYYHIWKEKQIIDNSMEYNLRSYRRRLLQRIWYFPDIKKGIMQPKLLIYQISLKNNIKQMSI